MFQSLSQASILHKKRQQFHMSIRRQQKDNYFRKQRALLMQKMIHHDQQQMRQLLNTVQKKQEWVSKRGLQLTGIPNIQWKNSIKQLQRAVIFFQGNYSLWIEKDIIKNLCQLFHDENLGLGLMYDVAKLLCDLMYQQSIKQNQRTSYIAQQILNLSYDIVQNVCSIAQNGDDFQKKAQYLIFLSNLACSNPIRINKAGGVRLFIDWTYFIINNNLCKRQNLFMIYEFYNIMVDEQKKLDYNVLFSIIQVLNDMCVIKQTDQLKRCIVVILLNMVRKQKQPIYTTVFQYSRLMNFIFEMALLKKQSIRDLAWRILAHLSSSSKSIGQIFQQYNFFSILLSAYQIQIQNPQNFDSITINMLICLSNIAMQSQRYKQIIIKNKFIDIVIDSLHVQRSNKLRVQGYGALCVILKMENYQLYNYLLMNYSIVFEKIVIGLENLTTNVVLEILYLLLFLIEKENSVYRQEGNVIYNILDVKFDFQKVLDQTETKFHKHAKICYTIDRIRQLQVLVD